MIYVDTGAWVCMHTRELRSAQVQQWFGEQDFASLCCSEWVKTEYASALSLKRRRGDLNDADFAGAHRTFAHLCVAGPVWLDLQTPDFLAAAGFCAEPEHGLRAGDGLHLAVALRARCSGLLSLDDLMNKNAKRLGLSVVDL